MSHAHGSANTGLALPYPDDGSIRGFRVDGFPIYAMNSPPPIVSTCPAIYEASGDIRKATAPVTPSGVPKHPIRAGGPHAIRSGDPPRSPESNAVSESAVKPNNVYNAVCLPSSLRSALAKKPIATDAAMVAVEVKCGNLFPSALAE